MDALHRSTRFTVTRDEGAVRLTVRELEVTGWIAWIVPPAVALVTWLGMARGGADGARMALALAGLALVLLRALQRLAVPANPPQVRRTLVIARETAPAGYRDGDERRVLRVDGVAASARCVVLGTFQQARGSLETVFLSTDRGPLTLDSFAEGFGSGFADELRGLLDVPLRRVRLQAGVGAATGRVALVLVAQAAASLGLASLVSDETGLGTALSLALGIAAIDHLTQRALTAWTTRILTGIFEERLGE